MYLTFGEAVILILKHATALQVSNLSAKLALVQAEWDYNEANVDFKIQEHIMASSQEPTVQTSAAFIMATNIGWLFLSLLRYHLIKVLEPSQSVVGTHKDGKDHWVKRFGKLLRNGRKKNN